MPHARSSSTRQTAFFSTLNNPPCSPARCDALGRRGREADPDSRSVSERGGRAAGPESPREQGRRHLVVNWRREAKETREGRQPGRLLSETRLWFGAENRLGFPRVLRRELAVKGHQNKPAPRAARSSSLSSFARQKIQDNLSTPSSSRRWKVRCAPGVPSGPVRPPPALPFLRGGRG